MEFGGEERTGPDGEVIDCVDGFKIPLVEVDSVFSSCLGEFFVTILEHSLCEGRGCRQCGRDVVTKKHY